MFLRKNLLGLSGIILTFGMVAFAQQPQPQTPNATPDVNLRRERIERRQRHREEMGQREGRRNHDQLGPDGIGHLLTELNLTDQQRQQSRAIMQRRLESTKAQREELLKLREKRMAGTFADEDEARARALRQEIREAMEGGHSEIAGILTAEQKARLEELKRERKTKIEQRMKERRDSLKNNPQ